MLFIKCCFQMIWLGTPLVGINHLIFQNRFIIKDSLPISSYTQHHLLYLKTNIWCDWSWFMFLWHFSTKLQVEIQSRGFFHLTYVEPKHQSNSHKQACANDFRQLIMIHWVCWLSPVGYIADYPQLMSWIWPLAISTGLPKCGERSNEKSPVRNIKNHFAEVWLLIAPSPHVAWTLCFSALSSFLKL